MDVHDVIAPELEGPVLDVGCGEGRLARQVVERGVAWVGVDSSWSQLEANLHRPLVLADMRHLPFRDGVFREGRAPVVPLPRRRASRRDRRGAASAARRRPILRGDGGA